MAAHDAQRAAIVKEQQRLLADRAHLVAELERMHDIMGNMPPIALWQAIKDCKDKLRGE